MSIATCTQMESKIKMKKKKLKVTMTKQEGVKHTRSLKNMTVAIRSL